MLLFATAGKCSSCVWAVLPDWSQKTRTRSSSKRFQMGTPKRGARWRVCECVKSKCYNQPRCNQYGVRFLCSIAVATSSQVIVWCQPVRVAVAINMVSDSYHFLIKFVPFRFCRPNWLSESPSSGCRQHTLLGHTLTSENTR